VTAVSVQIRPSELPSPDVVWAKAGHENFPVASRLLPSRFRGHLLAVYGVARLVDDIGDEAPGDRLAALDWAEHELERAYAGRASSAVFRALQESLASVELPKQCFADLVEANRRDQTVTRYATYEDLLGYCALSANPVGRLVLAVFGADDARRRQLSDQVCSGLQLVEHWQDVAEDAARGRVYLPLADLEHFGVTVAELTAGRATPAFRRLMAFEARRARDLLAAGDHLVRSLRGWARLAVAGFVAGGRSALDAIEDSGYDVLGDSPRPAKLRLARATLRTFAGRP
jgi:squalene synthase HpnC